MKWRDSKSIVLSHSAQLWSPQQPFTHEFPHADIHKLLSLDLLHQVIKGTFKDHLVTWVNQYLIEEHGEAHGLEIIQDIDCWCVLISIAYWDVELIFISISVVPPFPGLRHFPDGCDFAQWMGDDSKSLMKVTKHWPFFHCNFVESHCLHTGLSCCNCQTCPLRYGQMCLHIPWLLLHCLS